MENLSRERALKLHRQMWSEMKEEFGDNPSKDERYDFKREWIYNHFPNENVAHYCFLCEYAINNCENYYYEMSGEVCRLCPIKWRDKKGYNNCEGFMADKTDWRFSPISDILALPENEVE